jgi:hypothetical protein
MNYSLKYLFPLSKVGKFFKSDISDFHLSLHSWNNSSVCSLLGDYNYVTQWHRSSIQSDYKLFLYIRHEKCF